MGRKRRSQRGSRFARAAPHGEEECIRRLFHLQKHGAAPDVPDQRAEISHPGSESPHSGASDEPLYPLLFLHPGRSSGTDHYARGVVFSISRHLLAERPFVHGKGTAAKQRRLSQGRQRLPSRGRCGGAAGCRRPAQPADHPPTTRLLDAYPRAEVFKEGTQPDEPVAVLFDYTDRVLPQLHFQTPLPHPQDLRAQLRNWIVAADGEPHQRDLRRPAG